MDLEIIILSEVKSDRERQISHDITYIWNLKKKIIQMNLSTEQKQTHRLREQTFSYQVGRIWGATDWDFGVDMYTLLYLK